MSFNQSCFGIRGKKGIVDNTFLYFCLKNYVLNIQKRGQGSVFNTINLNSFDLMEIQMPKSFETQKQIATVLSAIDDKIELNNRINQELEGMAKFLYDYWFVQFDFPDESGNPYKSSGGKMVYDEVLKRNIPEGWEVKIFGDFISNDKSGDWGKEVAEGNYNTKVECIRGADINGINGKGEVKAPVRFILEKNEHKILQELDLVVEISGGSPTQSTGRLGFITKEVLDRFDNPIICSNFCKVVSLKSENQFFFFVNSWNRAYDNGILFCFEGKTSGIKNLLFDMFVNNYNVAEPEENLLTKFQNIISLYEKKRQENLKQNQKLAELRDWLLPMLMNGQVKVGGVSEDLNIAAEPEVGYSK